MPEELIVRHCAPTLAGMKTGSLFSCPAASRSEAVREIRAINRALVPKGLQMLPLRYARGHVLLYLYRPAQLRRDLQENQAQALLHRCGYCSRSSTGCLAQLGKRLRSNEEFPHEIGLFLGYPPEDVQGFIDQRAEGCKLCGCWKVYGDAEAAQKTFDRYKKCTELYCRRWADGCSVERLTVAS